RRADPARRDREAHRGARTRFDLVRQDWRQMTSDESQKKPITLEDRANDGDRLFSPAAARNRDPVLQVLREVLPAEGGVLEIASGTGEHVAHFATHLPGLRWQPSEFDETSRLSLRAW